MPTARLPANNPRAATPPATSLRRSGTPPVTGTAGSPVVALDFLQRPDEIPAAVECPSRERRRQRVHLLRIGVAEEDGIHRHVLVQLAVVDLLLHRLEAAALVGAAVG